MVLEFLLTSPEFDSSLCSRCAKLHVCVCGGGGVGDEKHPFSRPTFPYFI
jgi:hypothetical protein